MVADHAPGLKTVCLCVCVCVRVRERVCLHERGMMGEHKGVGAKGKTEEEEEGGGVGAHHVASFSSA